MGLGFSKAFIIILFIAVAVGYGSKNWINALVIIGVFAILKIIYNVLS